MDIIYRIIPFFSISNWGISIAVDFFWGGVINPIKNKPWNCFLR